MRRGLLYDARASEGRGRVQGPRDAAHLANYLFKATNMPIIEIVRPFSLKPPSPSPRRHARHARHDGQLMLTLRRGRQADKVEQFVERGARTQQAVFICVGLASTSRKAERMAAHAVAASHTKLWFGHSRDESKAVRTQFGVAASDTAIIAVDSVYGVQGVLTAPFDEPTLKEFIHQHRWPPVLRLTQAIYTRALEETRPLAILLASPSRPDQVRVCFQPPCPNPTHALPRWSYAHSHPLARRSD